MKSNKISAEIVMIEVTRRCNMVCDHCLRGPRQSRDISYSDINTFMSRFGYINTLTITGGEPSLAVDRIEFILDAAKKNKVNIGNFFIVTNGKRVTSEFLVACIKFYAYCSDNDLSGVEISSDEFHEEIPEKNKSLLSSLAFVRERVDPGIRMDASKWVIAEGRGKTIGTRTVYNEINPEHTSLTDIFPHDCYPDDDYYDNTVSQLNIYLNVLGKVISNCDLSYRSQAKSKNIICSVADLSMESIRAYCVRRGLK